MLELVGVKRHFGALRVIDGIDLAVNKGEVLGILGPNGAGKSTLFNLITGNLRLTSGQIRFEGRDVTQDKPWDRVRSGIGRTFQIPKPFGNLSVYENLLVCATQGGGQSLKAARQTAAEVMDLTALDHRAEAMAGGMSLLDLKRLELAKALATGPSLLLLDEIAGGLTDEECIALLDIIALLAKRGITIVWIEHVVHALMRVATRLAVVAEGGLIATGGPQTVLADPKVQEIYLGSVQ